MGNMDHTIFPKTFRFFILSAALVVFAAACSTLTRPTSGPAVATSGAVSAGGAARVSTPSAQTPPRNAGPTLQPELPPSTVSNAAVASLPDADVVPPAPPTANSPEDTGLPAPLPPPAGEKPATGSASVPSVAPAPGPNSSDAATKGARRARSGLLPIPETPSETPSPPPVPPAASKAPASEAVPNRPNAAAGHEPRGPASAAQPDLNGKAVAATPPPRPTSTAAPADQTGSRRRAASPSTATSAVRAGAATQPPGAPEAVSSAEGAAASSQHDVSGTVSAHLAGVLGQELTVSFPGDGWIYLGTSSGSDAVNFRQQEGPRREVGVCLPRNATGRFYATF